MPVTSPACHPSPVTAAAAVHINGDMADRTTKKLTTATLPADDFTSGSVAAPRERPAFKASRRCADGPVCGEAVDEIGCGHVSSSR